MCHTPQATVWPDATQGNPRRVALAPPTPYHPLRFLSPGRRPLRETLSSPPRRAASRWESGGARTCTMNANTRRLLLIRPRALQLCFVATLLLASTAPSPAATKPSFPGFDFTRPPRPVVRPGVSYKPFTPSSQRLVYKRTRETVCQTVRASPAAGSSPASAIGRPENTRNPMWQGASIQESACASSPRRRQERTLDTEAL